MDITQILRLFIYLPPPQTAQTPKDRTIRRGFEDGAPEVSGPFYMRYAPMKRVAFGIGEGSIDIQMVHEYLR